MRPLSIIVIWPKYATRANSHDSETKTIFARTIVHANILALQEQFFYNFRVQPLPIFVIWPKYAKRATLHDSEMATFFE